MTQYGPEFFRKFADIITEAEAPQQLDEGIIDTIKQKTAGFAEKVKQLPGFAEAYATAKAAVPQLKQIFTTSKSGAEVVDKIKQLTGANKPVAAAVAEGDNAMIGTGAVGGFATGGFMLWEIGSGLIDAAYAAGGLTGPAGIWFIVMPVVILVYCTGLCIAGATK